ncbi:MAG: DUF1573 domain-containing protein [Acidobacteria bacterium]|nr:DUF1573 domain-containing protein [Acidobacteriota bacterium]
MFLTLLCLAGLLMGQGAEITTEQAVLDMGHVTQGEEIASTITFRNSGNEELVITSVKTSCGCTAAKLEKMTYAPGESGEIAVTMKTARLQGEVSRKVSILSNASVHPFDITIKANVTSATTASN